MLIVRATTDIPERGISKGDEFRLYIVDAHHHMGKEKAIEIHLQDPMISMPAFGLKCKNWQNKR